MEDIFSVRPSFCFEVQKITGVSIGEGDQKNYQVQWAPMWISSLHLVGCEHLIEEFVSQQSEKGQVVDLTITADRVGTCKLQNDLQDDVLDGEYVPTVSDRQQFTEKVNTQIENNASKDYVDPTASGMVSSSGITDTVEGCKKTLNFEWEERSIEGINIDGGNIDTSVNNDTQIDIDPPANADGDIDRFVLDCEDLKSLVHFSETDAEADYKLQNVVEVKREEMVVEINLTEPNSSNEDARNKDESLHKPPKKHECDICHKVVKTKRGLSQHHTITHGIKKNSSYKCSYCDKTFVNESTLIEHLRVHTNERPYKCKFCKKAYKRKQPLLEHNCRYTGLT